MPAPPAASLRCLVVDDEPLHRLILQHHIDQTPALTLAGLAANGLQALAALQGPGPAFDVLFLDLEMPNLDGTEVLHRMPRPGPAVVLVSSRHDLRDDLLTDPRVVEFLVKPVLAAQFARVVGLLAERCR